MLDDTVIPKRYARVILNCMYTDKLDLSLIEPSRSGLSEVESLTFTGKVNPSGFEEAMELYQIGKYQNVTKILTYYMVYFYLTLFFCVNFANRSVSRI